MKIIFADQNMRCDDADVMMMQKKEKQAKSNLGKTPGHYSILVVLKFTSYSAAYFQIRLRVC